MVVIDWEADGLVRRLSGSVTTAELDASAMEIQGNSRLDDMRYNIHDFSAVTEAHISADDIEFMAVRAAISLRQNPGIKIAFVGKHPIVQQLMDAFNASGCSAHQVRRFDTLDEARRYASSRRTG